MPFLIDASSMPPRPVAARDPSGRTATAEVHVVPMPDGGWSVRDAPHGPPLSTHHDATEAARRAVDIARERDAPRVVLHDRYARTRVTHACAVGRHPSRR